MVIVMFIVKALLTLSSDKDPITYSDSKALLSAISDLDEAEQKMYSSFCCARSFIASTVSEVLHIMHKNDLVVTLPEFATVVHILALIPATSCSAERLFSALRRLKPYLRRNMGQQRVSNIAMIHTEKAYANLY